MFATRSPRVCALDDTPAPPPRRHRVATASAQPLASHCPRVLRSLAVARRALRLAPRPSPPAPPLLALQPLHELNSEPDAPRFEFGVDRFDELDGRPREDAGAARETSRGGKADAAVGRAHAVVQQAPFGGEPTLVSGGAFSDGLGGGVARRDTARHELAQLRRLIVSQCERFRSLDEEAPAAELSSPAPRDHSPMLQTPTAVGSKRNLAERGGGARGEREAHEDAAVLKPRRAGQWKKVDATATEPCAKPSGRSVAPCAAAAVAAGQASAHRL